MNAKNMDNISRLEEILNNLRAELADVAKVYLQDRQNDSWLREQTFDAHSKALEAIHQELIDELKAIRDVYDKMELQHEIDTFEKPEREFVTWRGWKMIRNVLTDRIEELTGKRQ